MADSSVSCVQDGHHSTHVSQQSRRALIVAVLFCTIMMTVEGIFGLIANSLAVLSDAVHMLADVFALSISLFALHASSWGATATHTYGWQRAEVVGALCSILTTWALVLWILLGAMSRVVEVTRCAMDSQRVQCEQIDSKLMFGVGLFGLLMNVVLAALLHSGGAHGHSHGTLSSAFHHGHDHSHNHREHDNHDHSHQHDNHDHSHQHDNHDHSHQHKHKHHWNRSGDEVTIEGTELSDSGVTIQFNCCKKLIADGTPASFEHSHSEHHSPKESTGNMNLRAAMLHVFGDCLQALGVVVAAAVIWIGNNSAHGTASSAHSYYNLADPLLSVLFGIITVFTTLKLINEVVTILLEQVPPTVDYAALQQSIKETERVQTIDDLHVWSVGPGFVVLSAHVRLDDCATMEEATKVLDEVSQRCSRLGIRHSTIQINYAPRDPSDTMSILSHALDD